MDSAAGLLSEPAKIPELINGKDMVCIYAAKEKQIKRLPRSRGVDARRLVRDENFKFMPKEALAIREKSIEK